MCERPLHAEPGDVTRPETATELTAEAMAELQAPPAERFIAPTAAMLAAALRGDADAMASAVTPSGCNAPKTCPAQYGAPTGWSTAFECAEVCNAGSCPAGEGQHGTAYNNSYRLKFTSGGASCTEWRVTTQPFCGCFRRGAVPRLRDRHRRVLRYSAPRKPAIAAAVRSG